MLKTARIVVLIAALGVAALGLLGGVAGLLFGLVRPPENQLTAITLSLSLLALAGGGGSLLAWHTRQAIQGRPSRPFRPRQAWLLLLAFGLALSLGQLVLTFDLLPLLTFPPLHITAAFLPPLAIVGLVGRPLGGITRWREMIWQMGSGAMLSTFLAGVLEATVLGGLFAAAIVAIALQPGGVERINRLADLMENATQSQQMDMLVALARSPGVVAAVFLIAAGFIPLVEEGVKAVGVALMSYRRPSLAQAFLWGVGSGAGFALAEGLFNSAGGLEAWGAVVFIRSGATLLHCTTGGLMGLAWYFLLVRRRWGRALGLYAAGVGLHALWNSLTVTVTLLSLLGMDLPDMGPGQVLAGLGILTIVVLLGLLALAVAGILAGLTWRLAREVSMIPGAEPGMRREHKGAI